MRIIKQIVLIFITSIVFFSCQNTNEDTEILNQIFPELVSVMELTIVKPFPPPPPLPQTIFPDYFNREKLNDTCINRQDFISYRSYVIEYHRNLQTYYRENYAFQYDSINAVIGIVDSLGYCMECGMDDQMPIQYSDIMENVTKASGTPFKLNLDQITNTGIFELKSTSELGWYPKVDFDEFVAEERDFYLSVVLRISRIHLNKSKTYGLFGCTSFMDHREASPLLIGIKKEGEKWKIDKTIPGF